VKIDTTRAHQVIQGIGGNFVHRFSNTSTILSQDPVSAYNLAHLSPTHVRVGMPLDTWELSNDDEDSDTFNWDNFRDGGKVHAVFEFMHEVSGSGIPIMASIWDVPDWMVTNPQARRERVVAPEMYDELVESTAAWLKFAQDVYGVTVDYISFNEADIGVNVIFSPANYAEIIKRAGRRFAELGLSTKWLLGDSSNSENALGLAQGIWRDKATRPYLGPLSFHSWDADAPDSALREIGAWAEARGLEVWAAEVGYNPHIWRNPDTFTTWENALQLARIYSRLLKLARVAVPFYWQMMNDYQLVSGDGETPYPAFYIIQQLRRHLPPGSQIIETPADTDTRYSFAAASPDHLMVHLTNTGASPETVTLEGLPAGTYTLTRSSETENAAHAGTFEVEGRAPAFELPARSVSILSSFAP
jgi:O-glycosyl hydrolase